MHNNENENLNLDPQIFNQLINASLNLSLFDVLKTHFIFFLFKFVFFLILFKYYKYYNECTR